MSLDELTYKVALLTEQVEAWERNQARLLNTLAKRDREIDRLKEQKDIAYSERNRVVALAAKLALALGSHAGLGKHQPEALLTGTSSQ